MIFKYFAYDKKLKDWLDTKAYCSICMPLDMRKIKNLVPLFYDALIASKLITIPAENFSITDSSSFPGIKTFTLSHLTSTKRINVGRLTQLPDKANAENNSKIKDSWNSMLFVTQKKAKVPNEIRGGWRDPLRASYGGPSYGQPRGYGQPAPFINPPVQNYPAAYNAVWGEEIAAVAVEDEAAYQEALINVQAAVAAPAPAPAPVPDAVVIFARPVPYIANQGEPYDYNPLDLD